MRLGAMRTALAAHNDKTKFLDTAGVLDVLKFRLVEAKSSSDMEKLVQFTKQLLNEEKGIINQNTEGTSIEELEDEEIHLL